MQYSLPRALCDAEHMIDVFDRASTMNFTTVARVRGALTAERLEGALSALVRRHPLLGAGLERGPRRTRYVPGKAEPIPLHALDAEPDAWRIHAEQSLTHRVWRDDGPRAELTWLRHGPGDSTLLLCLHHAVSDGSSGFVAMRDLLALAADDTLPELSPVPPQNAFYPKDHGDFRWKARTVALVLRSVFAGKPFRFRHAARQPRRTRLERIQLGEARLGALMARARADGATVHGVLCAALGLAASAESSRPSTLVRVTHPVDLRRYLRPRGSDISPDAVGYYVSSVDTDHRVEAGRDPGTLAAEITAAVRAQKAADVPLLMGPLAGYFLTRGIRDGGDLPEFRDTVERTRMSSTFALTNLARVENMGVRREVGDLRVEDMFFVAAGSVVASLGGAATTFGDVLTLTINWVEPLVSEAAAQRIVERTRATLEAYAAAGVSIAQGAGARA